MCSCSTVQTGFIDRRFTATHSNRATGKGLACGRGQDGGPRSLLGREASRGNGDHLALTPGSSRLVDAHAASLWLANSYFPLDPLSQSNSKFATRKGGKIGEVRPGVGGTSVSQLRTACPACLLPPLSPRPALGRGLVLNGGVKLPFPVLPRDPDTRSGSRSARYATTT